MSPTAVVAYLVLFASAGFFLVVVALFLGRLLRPKAPSPEKLATYECGEPTVGTSFVQFDLRFYVVALVFIIFDVEVAFFFPWATVFGKTAKLSVAETVVQGAGSAAESATELSPWAREEMRQLGVTAPRVPDPAAGTARNSETISTTARLLARAAMADMIVFFLVLMVGFAYVWSRGDLDWVRAIPRRPAEAASPADAVGERAAERATVGRVSNVPVA
jgi:NADH-quinone oxidoreductase subunit A